MDVLLSGVLSVVIATAVTLTYQHFMEQLRQKRDTALFVMSWVDEYQSLVMQKQADKLSKHQTGEVMDMQSVDQAGRRLLSMGFSRVPFNRLFLDFPDSRYINAWHEVEKRLVLIDNLAKETCDWPKASQELSEIMDKDFSPHYYHLAKLLFEASSLPFLKKQIRERVGKWYRANLLAPKGPDRI
jgi:hypothetical protein